MVIKKLGKKEDEHVVASDAQLDAKLEVNRRNRLSSCKVSYVVNMAEARNTCEKEFPMGCHFKKHVLCPEYDTV